MTADREPSAATGLAHLVDVLSQRLQAGEPLELSAALRDHPEHAEELRRLLPALGALDGLTPLGDFLPTAQALGPLGDFRLIREVGRGGMGVVYEAEQISLRRKVALKVLPFAATLDSRQLQRFRHEAQAAALLHHPNIVPVHAVGCERGVHYYAMQFIEGRTLAELVRELRGGAPARAARAAEASASTARGTTGLTPRPIASTEHCRSAARLSIQAAEALEFAHQNGVVHRDIKPANLLLDARGELWVTDFGLALVRGHPELTVTGDLLGTLRYMSPEQAEARPGVVDHRTDVFSLGATLYELLTLEPAVPGDDRAAILKRIAQFDPIPPRRHNPAVPADLETVVLKAMARSRDERYASAREFGDDLRRFLEGLPIHARRVTRIQRAQKWAGRHSRMLGALAVMAAAAMLAVVIGLFKYADHQRELAEERERELVTYHTRLQVAAREERDARLELQKARLQSARATRLLGEPGYHDTYLPDLSHAVGRLPDLTGVERLERRRYLDDYQNHLALVRKEVIAGLGDPLGSGAGYYARAVDWKPLAEARAATVAVTPDGRWKAERNPGSDEIELTSRGAERIVARAACPLGKTLDLKVSPDGRILVAGCERGLAIWNLPDLTIRITSPGGPVRFVAVDRRGRRIAALGKLVELYDADSNRLLRKYRPSGHLPEAVGFSLDGNYLLVRGDRSDAWSLRDSPEKFHLDGHDRAVIAVAFGPDGLRIASTSWDRTIRLWDLNRRTPIHTWSLGESMAGALAFSPDGRFLAAGTDKGVVQLFDPQTGAEAARGQVEGGVISRLQFTPDGRMLLAAAGKRGLTAWALPRLEPVAVDRVPDGVEEVADLAVHPNRETMVYVTLQGELHQRPLRGGPDRLLLSHCRCDMGSLGFDRAGEWLTLMRGNGLAVIDWQTGAGVETVHARRITHSPDGRWAATATDTRAVSVVDRPTGSVTFTLPPEAAEVSSLAWAPGRRLLAVGLEDGCVAVWDIDRVHGRFNSLGINPREDLETPRIKFQVELSPPAKK